MYVCSHFKHIGNSNIQIMSMLHKTKQLLLQIKMNHTNSYSSLVFLIYYSFWIYFLVPCLNHILSLKFLYDLIFCNSSIWLVFIWFYVGLWLHKSRVIEAFFRLLCNSSTALLTRYYLFSVRRTVLIRTNPTESRSQEQS